MEEEPHTPETERVDQERVFVVACLDQFANSYVLAEAGSVTREVQRRNLCLATIILAELQQPRMGFRASDANDIVLHALEPFLSPNSQTATALIESSANRGMWRKRERNLYASVVDAQKRGHLPSSHTLLASLADNDGQFYYNLSMPVA